MPSMPAQQLLLQPRLCSSAAVLLSQLCQPLSTTITLSGSLHVDMSSCVALRD